MIRFTSVHFSYYAGQPVLNGVSLEIPAGLNLLLGPNGCGKSTLLKMAAGVERPDGGRIEIDGHDLWRDEVAARRSLAYISEQPDLTPYATIRDVLNLVCRLRGEPLQAGRDALEKAGLGLVAGRSIREVSMGQRRRAVLAAAWIGLPSTIVLDEPLEAMDRVMREHILLWIEHLWSAGSCLIIATHDIEPFVAWAARAVTVSGGRAQLLDLPAGTHEDRLSFLEGLSRGAAVPKMQSQTAATDSTD